MASDENSNMVFYDDYDHDTDDGYSDHQLPHQHNLSRLSVCTSSMHTNEDDDYQDCDGMKMFMSRLSIESFDADEELSDDEKEGVISMLDLSSDSDKEPGCYSLPATPPRRRNRGGGGVVKLRDVVGGKEYASENEAQKGNHTRKNSRRKRRVIRERWIDSDNNNNKSDKKKEEESIGLGMCNYYGNGNSFSGESENGGVVVITRPKGGKRALCMDLDEVKACRDLGFELEHERMLEMPSRVSLSGSTLDTSSGGNSPIANWRISSPGDDPRDVKARLKVWAQAVALASTSKHGCF
ncbi:uncharacterized protein LOC8270833 [Ricinus communis]|uniref:Fold protein n=1 Tax=Ricinus communis TaxID=3988 RepID=B9RN22_RICCO|nr:uncharacterized protein LOC8270833 [Ricinus communis]EEF47145.1 conserved hypothetical protein [Ricinus communis]|eukprot:XP_002515161.1 uncharacterized protein LOC8270833 [Ricinus communis]